MKDKIGKLHGRPAKRKNKPGAGRPFVKLDEERIGRLAFAGCKNSEIAHILGCDDETLKNNYSPILDKKRAERKAAFRTKQTERALKDGEIAMLIFIGKNELEQADKTEVGGNVNLTHQLSMEDLNKSLAACEKEAKE